MRETEHLRHLIERLLLAMSALDDAVTALTASTTALTAAVASGRGVLLLDEPMASLDPVLASRLEAVLASGDWTLVTAGHA